MTNLNRLFRERLGIPYDTAITFENLNAILEKAMKTIPFENMSIIENRTDEITKENLVNKIFVQNEGGLCYELNTIFYFFLLENGFDIYLIRAMRYDYSNQTWKETLGKTHVANIIIHNGKSYIADIGFGGNSPLTLVPMNGEPVTSNNGEFKVENVECEPGDHIFYMKLKHKDTEWKIGYAFDSKKVLKDLEEINEVQSINTNHPASNFNKKPLITKFTDNGMIILTDTSFTEWIDGKVKKEEIDRRLFPSFAKRYFSV